MYTLSIDPSSKRTGYALFYGRKLVDYGAWEYDGQFDNRYTQNSDAWRGRIQWMAECLDKYFKEHEISKVLSEDVIPMVDNSQTVKVLSALQGCIMTVCYINNVDIEFIPVETWKQKANIDITHSKEYKDKLKWIKEDPSHGDWYQFKKYAKAYEKKLTIHIVNNFFKLGLIWKSVSSCHNQSDEADAIALGATYLFDDLFVYDSKQMQKLVDEIAIISAETREKQNYKEPISEEQKEYEAHRREEKKKELKKLARKAKAEETKSKNSKKKK